MTYDVWEFPAGPDDRRNAYLLAIWSQDPALHTLADNLAGYYPELETRAWKAAGIVIDGKLNPAENGHVAASVEGSSEWGANNITAIDGELCCDCPDWTGLTAPVLPTGLRLCKHFFAHLIAVNADHVNK